MVWELRDDWRVRIKKYGTTSQQRWSYCVRISSYQRKRIWIWIRYDCSAVISCRLLSGCCCFSWFPWSWFPFSTCPLPEFFFLCGRYSESEDSVYSNLEIQHSNSLCVISCLFSHFFLFILSSSQDKMHCQLSSTVCIYTTWQWASFISTTDSFSWCHDRYTLACKISPSFDGCGTSLSVSLSLSSLTSICYDQFFSSSNQYVCYCVDGRGDKVFPASSVVSCSNVVEVWIPNISVSVRNRFFGSVFSYNHVIFSIYFGYEYWFWIHFYSRIRFRFDTRNRTFTFFDTLIWKVNRICHNLFRYHDVILLIIWSARFSSVRLTLKIFSVLIRNPFKIAMQYWYDLWRHHDLELRWISKRSCRYSRKYDVFHSIGSVMLR